MMFASQPLSRRRADLTPVPAPGKIHSVLPENQHLTKAGHAWWSDCNRAAWAADELARIASLDTAEADHARRVLCRLYYLATSRHYEPAKVTGAIPA